MHFPAKCCRDHGETTGLKSVHVCRFSPIHMHLSWKGTLNSSQLADSVCSGDVQANKVDTSTSAKESKRSLWPTVRERLSVSMYVRVFFFLGGGESNNSHAKQLDVCFQKFSVLFERLK